MDVRGHIKVREAQIAESARNFTVSTEELAAHSERLLRITHGFSLLMSGRPFTVGANSGRRIFAPVDMGIRDVGGKECQVVVQPSTFGDHELDLNVCIPDRWPQYPEGDVDTSAILLHYANSQALGREALVTDAIVTQDQMATTREFELLLVETLTYSGAPTEAIAEIFPEIAANT